ncbi:thermonuclease family protein [Prosthecochloris sp. SCSIO W1101]|uniref:thermonuclease family protein n=1 Tax=Prosthecochloris sp. SCSIO W1101 TaxID=2992242 RepID=UPI00223D7ADD|nr:thermonuclease family protein [Prosthecochloris sp. SCSIO W1101]UZJ42805.1 thermonuclease family protein [Prosthecochloris sp. SCSIO W1101]
MQKVGIFWDPKGFELDSLGKKQYLRATDGDTPYVSMSIRMLSIDTPEVHYPGRAKPSNQDENLAQLAEWMKQGLAPIDEDLSTLLYPKLSTGKAGTLQEQQGEKATEAFRNLIEEKLSKPDSSRKRSVYLRAADEPFDQYGRLLVYLAPNYNAEERASMSAKDRATFNLLMVSEGWAATLPIYPSLPKHFDLVLLQETGKEAVKQKKGAWLDPLTLTGYEFRMCVKLYEVTRKIVQGKRLSNREKYSWISRFCMDMTTREIYYPQSYFKVKPYNRIFIWPEDVTEAVGRLNLAPAE